MLPELRLDKLERLAILQALEQSGGNFTRAAELLGVCRSTVHRKLQRYGRLALDDAVTEKVPINDI